MEKIYEVWTEGYIVTGNSSGAKYYGSTPAISFKAACIKLIGLDALDEDKTSVWGCKCYDNEVDARKTFG